MAHPGSSLALVAEAITTALDHQGIGMVQQAIEQRRCQSTFVVEDLRPVLEGPDTGNDRRAALIALTDDLEEVIGAELIDRQIPQFVNYVEINITR